MSDKELVTDFDKFSYSLGMSVASNLIRSGVKKVDSEKFMSGVSDTFSGEMPKILPEEANKILDSFLAQSKDNNSDENLKNGLAFLSENSKKEGVTELASGLQYSIETTGDGDLPKPTDTVRCHYHGTLIDGTVFDSSVERGQPAEFPVNRVIQGWVEALQIMPVGSKWRLFIPSDLAYGENGAGGVIGPNAALIFDIELLEII